MICIRKDDCINFMTESAECRRCQTFCPEKAVIIKKDGRTWMDRKKCTQCGLCEYECEYDAIYDDGYFWCTDMWIKY